eukprot:3763119-Pleurochrysis_carterae.AAC.1
MLLCAPAKLAVPYNFRASSSMSGFKPARIDVCVVEQTGRVTVGSIWPVTVSSDPPSVRAL